MSTFNMSNAKLSTIYLQVNHEDPFAILGVSVSATSEEIKAAYRTLALRLHPDKTTSAKQRKLHTPLFQRLLTAYETISGEDANDRGRGTKRIPECEDDVRARVAAFKEKLKTERKKAQAAVSGQREAQRQKRANAAVKKERDQAVREEREEVTKIKEKIRRAKARRRYEEALFGTERTPDREYPDIRGRPNPLIERLKLDPYLWETCTCEFCEHKGWKETSPGSGVVEQAFYLNPYAVEHKRTPKHKSEAPENPQVIRNEDTSLTLTPTVEKGLDSAAQNKLAIEARWHKQLLSGGAHCVSMDEKKRMENNQTAKQLKLEKKHHVEAERLMSGTLQGYNRGYSGLMVEELFDDVGEAERAQERVTDWKLLALEDDVRDMYFIEDDAEVRAVDVGFWLKN